ncbi:DUF72 domain-containing protein [Chitinophaga parva]|nr:DUF72 domain-containing protein [Chitinophaga parva]
MKHPLFFCGTSNMVFAEPNKAAFPLAFQDKPRLTYYASRFNSLEVNSSFYKVPKPATVARWATEVPEHFRFTFKLWKGITHVRGSVHQQHDLLHFLRVIDEAGQKTGCLLIQFPASVGADHAPVLEQMLGTIVQAGNKYRIALEMRHTSWYTKRIYALADTYRAGIVLHDMPRSLFQETATAAPFVYLRFHGPAGDYKGGYTDAQLQQYATRIHTWMGEGKEVYVYFNNTIGDALQNAITLRSMVTGG